MKILLLTKYDYSGASSRYRTLQYLPYLRKHGLSIEVSSLLDEKHIHNRFAGKTSSLWYFIKRYLKRLRVLITQRKKFDIFWIEGELFPYLPFFLEKWFLPKNYVAEYDDAIFHNYDQHRLKIVRWLLTKKISQIMKYSRHVVVGNHYVEEYALKANAPKVSILPTVVDEKVYCASMGEKSSHSPIVIGWLGSPTTVKYLSLIESALTQVAQKVDIQLMVIGGEYPSINGVNTVCYHWPHQWSEKEEIAWLRQIDIGIMPLVDSPWEKGKCGFKLIKYMGCAKPVIASPVSSNNDIVIPEKTGYLADTMKDWEASLLNLIQNNEARRQFGEAGRERMVEKYSLHATAPLMYHVLMAAIE